MIENEIQEILEGAADNGERLNKIADQFRRGRDVNDLVVLLDSRNAELVSIGAWILGELPIESYNFTQVTFRLRKLIDHENSAVRFHAFGALFPTLDRGDVSTHALLRKLQNDPNEGVRRSAHAAAAQLSLR